MSGLSIDYRNHDGVTEIVDRLAYAAEHVSIAFDGWEEPHVKGPGLYFAVVADREYGAYADPMGENRWPRGECASVFSEDAFVDAAERVGLARDGGVVVAVDGEVQAQMVRFRDLGAHADEADLMNGVEYEPWMGSRHMSAIETSVRPEVVATVTLSEESGRVSVFRDGEAHTYTRTELGGRWRGE
ncbi:diadenylate cyclase [Halorubrum vacuolatum]|uniref:DisA checkpoint controller nucleotide-binding n=1 Tax=Halorubrum vacuolatum TaxID=63740 RepID=A0A238V7E1_HALVU|nr:diadenylate cyclase [Halorubrum vacuolatum]SNR30176.1 DisA checkpoint controller nucleotide-binding [Halorubrum vacuolatum]